MIVKGRIELLNGPTVREAVCVEVSAIDPMESMKAIENPALGGIATEVRTKLQRVIAQL